MQRKILLFGLFLFSLNLLAGVERTVLKVFSLPDPKKTDVFTKADREVIKAFKDKNPDIDLRSYTGVEIENMSMDSKILLAIAGGVAPDVVYVNFRQSATYINNDFLLPLDKYIKKMPEKLVEERVPDPVWPVIKRKKENQKKEHIWAFPYETLVRVLMYRKDLFRKVGLDPGKPPQNWDELFRYSRQLTIPKDGIYGMFIPAGRESAFGWKTYFWSAGGEILRKNKQGDWRAAFNGKAAVKATELYLKLINTQWIDSEGNNHEGFVIREGNWGDKWMNGKIGMKMGYMTKKNLGGEIDPNLYGIAPPPKGPADRGTSEINCRMMGIFSGAGESNNGGLGERDPEKVKEAAWRYIWFYNSKEARKIRTKVMVEEGYGKMVNPLNLKEFGYEEYLKYVPKQWLDIFEETIEHGRPEPYVKNCQKIYQFMSHPLEKCIALDRKGKLGKDQEEKREKISEIFDSAVENTNQKMLKELPKDVRNKRNRVALIVAVFIFTAFVFVMYKVWNIFTPDDTFSPQSEKRITKLKFYAFVILLPALISIVLWKYIPLVMGSLMAFQDYQIVGDSDWIGIQNFADVLFDSIWWSSVLKTLYYIVLFLGIGFFPPIILAILLQEVSKGKVFYRILFYLPAIISGIIVIYLWKLLYDPSAQGALNQILISLGLQKFGWLREAEWAMLLTVIPSVWASIGPNSIIYLAALKGIPDELYEAAEIDGSNFFHKVAYIVLPKLKPLIIIQFIAAFIIAAQQGGFILVMTFGGPNRATEVADFAIFKKAYLYLEFGIATAMAWLLAILIMGFTVYQMRKLSNMEFRANIDEGV